MMLLHVIVIISHANMYVTHVLMCVAFLIWLILYVSILRTHAFVINSVEIRLIFRVGFFKITCMHACTVIDVTLPMKYIYTHTHTVWGRYRLQYCRLSCTMSSTTMSGCLQISQCSMESMRMGRVGLRLRKGILARVSVPCVPHYPFQSHVWLILHY